MIWNSKIIKRWKSEVNSWQLRCQVYVVFSKYSWITATSATPRHIFLIAEALKISQISRNSLWVYCSFSLISHFLAFLPISSFRKSVKNLLKVRLSISITFNRFTKGDRLEGYLRYLTHITIKQDKWVYLSVCTFNDTLMIY